MVIQRKGGGGEIAWEFGTSRCKLLYMEQINRGVLLYSTGNYIQYPVINHNGKEKIRKHLLQHCIRGSELAVAKCPSQRNE